MAAFTRIGYGQVEPNQLSAKKNGQIYASLPLDTQVTVLQNGEFMYYDYASGKVSATSSFEGAEPMLVYNEVKRYEDYLGYKDFAMIKVGENYVTNDPAVGRITTKNADGTIYGDGALTVSAKVSHSSANYRMDGYAPRLFKTTVGDIMTTNMVKVDGVISYAKNDLLVPKLNSSSHTLVLEKSLDSGASSNMVWQVAKVYTMPDGQPGLKLQRVK